MFDANEVINGLYGFVYDENGKQMQENVLTAKGIAVSLNQPGLKIDYSRPKAKEQEAER